MQCNPDTGDQINSFALVSYLPGPLGSFLDCLRQELIPSCCAKSHVTLLPPRSLSVGQNQAEQRLGEMLRNFAPFQLELDGVEVFESTGVIYVALTAGTVDDLRRMHERLNQGPLAAPESHPYHPHVTLAQDFPPQELSDMERLAKERWLAYPGPRSFRVDRLTFVQNTKTNHWRDLADFPLEDSVLVT